MKFLKISFLVIFVAIVVIFLYCKPREPENLPPLTQHERKQAERYIKNHVDNHFILIERFYNRAAQLKEPESIDAMFNKIEKEYERLLAEDTREFKFSVPGEPGHTYTTKEDITAYLRGQWDAGHKIMRINPVVSANLTFEEEPNYNNPALPEEEDMHVLVTVEIHLVDKELPENETATETFERYHRRLCDW